MAGEWAGAHRGDLEKKKSGNEAQHYKARHQIDEIFRVVDCSSLRLLSNDQMTTRVRRCHRTDLVKLKAEQGFEAAPKQKIGFAECHPWDEPET